jgi:hypothetical protein
VPNPLTKRDQIRNSSVDSHYIERAPTHKAPLSFGARL